ncbi:MAG: DHH family phosphoesterase, partial [Atribacterota bacterium]
MDSQEIVQTIIKNERFIISSHQNIDGDGLGSMIALYAILFNQSKNVVMLYDETVPYFYHYLPFIEQIKPVSSITNQVNFKNAVFFVVDCSNPQRLGLPQQLLEKCKTVINIDHHPDNSSFGDLNYVVPNYPSTTILIYQLVKELGEKIDRNIATGLLTGLITDTGGFQYTELNSTLLPIIEELTAAGASVASIMRYVFKYRRQEALKLLGVALNHLYYDPHANFGVIYLLQDDFRACGATEEDAEGIVDYGLYIPGSEISVFIREVDRDNFKISLRSQGQR